MKKSYLPADKSKKRRVVKVLGCHHSSRLNSDAHCEFRKTNMIIRRRRDQTDMVHSIKISLDFVLPIFCKARCSNHVRIFKGSEPIDVWMGFADSKQKIPINEISLADTARRLTVIAFPSCDISVEEMVRREGDLAIGVSIDLQPTITKKSKRVTVLMDAFGLALDCSGFLNKPNPPF